MLISQLLKKNPIASFAVSTAVIFPINLFLNLNDSVLLQFTVLGETGIKFLKVVSSLKYCHKLPDVL